MNRAEFRKGGLQGRQHAVLVGPKDKTFWQGKRRGSFFSRMPAISAATANLHKRGKLLDLARDGQRIALPGRSSRKRTAQRQVPQ